VDDRFIWDVEKYYANIEKHGIAFEEAATVFDDDYALYEPDDAHSTYEERFKVIGMSEQLKVLVVCHCYRNGDSLIRIISARKADKEEINYYLEVNS
jgi:uncharacterized DUF497 family protein